MTVQRQYTLPNCNLIVEGLTGGDEMDSLAPLTVVLNTECKFPGIADTLTGGREFLDALVKTVGDYAQSILSGIDYPALEEGAEADPVVLKPGDNHRHLLMATVPDAQGSPVRKTLNLTTVQLFDLMEAIDQLLADSQTLPDMALQVSSLHRRYVRPAEPIAKRVVPAAAGLSALAASAALLFMVPVPEFEPERPRDEQDTAALVEEGTVEGPPQTATPSPGDPVAGQSEAGTEQSASTDAVSAATALSRLTAAPEITDSDQLDQLETELEETLAAEMPSSLSFADPLVYRVALSEDGDLLGYKYENDAALQYVDNTPLPELMFIPVDAGQTSEEPVALFRVTFAPDGEVSAEPLNDSAE